jgi:hypothetical protein
MKTARWPGTGYRYILDSSGNLACLCEENERPSNYNFSMYQMIRNILESRPTRRLAVVLVIVYFDDSAGKSASDIVGSRKPILACARGTSDIRGCRGDF